MLTDIFAARYTAAPLAQTFTEKDSRLLVQTFRILSEDVCPYYSDKKEIPYAKAFWTDIHDKLSRELGLTSLSPLTSYYTNAMNQSASYTWPMMKVCENWMLQSFSGSISADVFIKERLSLVELGFRKREEDIAAINANLPQQVSSAELQDVIKRASSNNPIPPSSIADAVRAANATLNQKFVAAVAELNERFRQAGYDLNYHNGFIQRTTDDFTSQHIEAPFWVLVSDPKWKNVDTHMKEAFDRRDAGQPDPAFPAACALESTVKIISDEKGWTYGKESGAANYIDNLRTEKFLADWEADSMKAFFTKVRNPLSHGPGSAQMPRLTEHQTNWAIDTCIVWINSLIRRGSGK